MKIEAIQLLCRCCLLDAVLSRTQRMVPHESVASFNLILRSCQCSVFRATCLLNALSRSLTPSPAQSTSSPYPEHLPLPSSMKIGLYHIPATASRKGKETHLAECLDVNRHFPPHVECKSSASGRSLTPETWSWSYSTLCRGSSSSELNHEKSQYFTH